MAEGLAVLPSALIPTDCAEAAKEAKIANKTSTFFMVMFVFSLQFWVKLASTLGVLTLDWLRYLSYFSEVILVLIRKIQVK
jgi:hypothetical protein